MDSVGSHTNSPVLNTPVGTLRYTAPETLRGILENGGDPRQTTRLGLQKLDLYSVGIVAHIMLCGQMPFSARTKPQLATQMEAGAQFASAAWTRVSPEAKDFVQKLLYADPGSRLTAEQALRHPWIVNWSPKDEDDLKAEASQSLTKPPQELDDNKKAPQASGSFTSLPSTSPSDSVTFEPIVSNRDGLSTAFQLCMKDGELGSGGEEDEDDEPKISEVLTSANYPPPGTELRIPTRSLLKPHQHQQLPPHGLPHGLPPASSARPQVQPSDSSKTYFGFLPQTSPEEVPAEED